MIQAVMTYVLMVQNLITHVRQETWEILVRMEVKPATLFPTAPVHPALLLPPLLLRQHLLVAALT